MADILVLDASALCKLLRNEPESDAVEAHVQSQLERGGIVLTSSIASIELVTCARKAIDEGEGTPKQIAQAVGHILKVIQIAPDADEKEIAALIDLAHKTGLTGPDASYVRLAHGNRLLSFDEKQKTAARILKIVLQ